MLCPARRALPTICRRRQRTAAHPGHRSCSRLHATGSIWRCIAALQKYQVTRRCSVRRARPIPGASASTVTPCSGRTCAAGNPAVPGGERANEGVTCTVCRQFVGDSAPSVAPTATASSEVSSGGRVVCGPFAGAVGNPYHPSKQSPAIAADPCHSVVVDRNENGAIESGPDLVCSGSRHALCSEPAPLLLATPGEPTAEGRGPANPPADRKSRHRRMAAAESAGDGTERFGTRSPTGSTLLRRR